MLLEVQTGAAEPLRWRVRRPMTLGGSQADAVTVPGLPPAALRLEPRPAGIVVCPAVPGVRVGSRRVAPGMRRLVRPGERASLHGLWLTIAGPAAGDPTRTAAAALLRAAARDPGAPLGPHLVVLTGPLAGRRAALGAGLVVGRGRGSSLRLADPAASRCHVRIQPGPEGATAEDLGAKNRLEVNGVPVERRPVPLRPGDVLTIGETELAYESPDAGRPGGDPRRGRRPPLLLARRAAPGGARRALPAGLRPLVAAALLAISGAALAAIASCG